MVVKADGLSAYALNHRIRPHFFLSREQKNSSHQITNPFYPSLSIINLVSVGRTEAPLPAVRHHRSSPQGHGRVHHPGPQVGRQAEAHTGHQRRRRRHRHGKPGRRQ